MDSEEIFLCHQCGKLFYRLSTLESHTKWKHMVKTNEFMCDQCGRTFQKKYNLIKHLDSGIHDVSETVKCALCDFRALNRKLMGEHYQNFHGINLKERNKYFKNAEEFYTWKSDFENKTRSRFVKMSSSRKRKNGFIRSTYFCHRDGNFVPKGRNLRHLKVKGSNKINAHCPAKMDVDIGERIVIVTYIDTHLGHELDLSRLSLDPVDKALIAKKLALQVPFEKILDEINNSKQNSELKRVNLLTRKDLWNIVDAYKINPKEVVYSKTRVRRKRKMEKPKKEPKRNRVYYKVLKQDPNTSTDEQEILYNIEENEEFNGDQVVTVKQENEENVILCPVILRDENNEYIQEYAVITNEDDGESGACLIINSQGELESISGHRIIYTEDGEMICPVEEDEEKLHANEESVVSVAQGMNEDLGEVVVLNEEESINEEEVQICDNSLMAESDLPAGEGPLTETNEIFEIETIKEEASNCHLATNSNNNYELTTEEVGNVINNSITRVEPLKKTVDDFSDMLHIENSRIKNNELIDLSSTDEMHVEYPQPDYEVTISGFDEEEDVNEYVIISTKEEEELDVCNVISTADDAQSDDFECPIIPTETVIINGIKEEVKENSQIKQEAADTFGTEEEFVEISGADEPQWDEKRKEVLHKLLNVHNMINNEQQLQVFTNNISSLENVLKALSNSESAADTSGSEPPSKKKKLDKHSNRYS